MAFCCKDKQLVSDSYTVLENKFILNYMLEENLVVIVVIKFLEDFTV